MNTSQASARGVLVAAVAVFLAGGCGAADTPPSTGYTPSAVQPTATAGTAAPFVATTTAGTGVATTLPPPPPLINPTVAAASGTGGARAAGSGGAGAAAVAVVAGTSGAGTGPGAAGTGSSAAGTGGSTAPAPVQGKGTCCPDGNCLCHGDVPAMLTVGKGPYKTAQVNGSTGTVVYPTDAEPPFAALSICPGFLNTGPEMAAWGPFYASWGIVTVITNTGGADIPDVRSGLLLGSIEELKKMNTDSKSPLMGKLSGRYGTSGYSMGGGGTTIAASQTPSLLSSVGLAAWGGSGTGTKVPTILFCGDADVVAPCNMSDPVYAAIPMATPKMMIVIPGATHFNWFGPEDTTGGISGKYALAFQKVYLEGDTRWKALLTTKPTGGAKMTTNIQ